MSFTVSIDKVGRLVLPKSVRERFHLKGGSKLRLEPIGDHLELTPLADEEEPSLIRRNSLLVVPATGKDCDAVEVVSADREERESVLTDR